MRWRMVVVNKPLGIRNSASHTEVIIRADGQCNVIEIGARLGAGHIGFLLQHATGINPWTIQLDIALGHPADLSPTQHRYATVRFITSPRAGRLRTVSGLPQPGGHVARVHVRRQAGDVVEVARSNQGRLGHLIVTGEDPATVEEQADQVLADIVVDVEPATPAGGPARTSDPPDQRRAATLRSQAVNRPIACCRADVRRHLPD